MLGQPSPAQFICLWDSELKSRRRIYTPHGLREWVLASPSAASVSIQNLRLRTIPSLCYDLEDNWTFVKFHLGRILWLAWAREPSWSSTGVCRSYDVEGLHQRPCACAEDLGQTRGRGLSRKGRCATGGLPSSKPPAGPPWSPSDSPNSDVIRPCLWHRQLNSSIHK